MTSKKVGVLGSGVVAQALANGFLENDFAVKLGTRDSTKLSGWLKGAGSSASVGTFAEAAAFGEMIVLAAKGSSAPDVLRLAGTENLKGKTVVDTTNPIADSPPINGVIQYFTGPNESLMERLQKQVPEANFVKCFSSVGSALMVNPNFGGVKPTMFICGNSAAAKEEVKGMLTIFGWETQDMGMVEAARAIEPLAMLWCIPGLRQNSWMHAFKLLKK
jgi:hypothetical protein